jgi:hypothetical protein
LQGRSSPESAEIATALELPDFCTSTGEVLIIWREPAEPQAYHNTIEIQPNLGANVVDLRLLPEGVYCCV